MAISSLVASLPSSIPQHRFLRPPNPLHLIGYGLAGATIEFVTQIVQGGSVNLRRLSVAFLSGATCGYLGQQGPFISLQRAGQQLICSSVGARGFQKLRFISQAGICGGLEGGFLGYVDSFCVNQFEEESNFHPLIGATAGAILGFFLGPLLMSLQSRFTQRAVENGASPFTFFSKGERGGGGRNESIFERSSPTRSSAAFWANHREGKELTEGLVSALLRQLPEHERPIEIIRGSEMPRILGVGEGDGTIARLIRERSGRRVFATDLHEMAGPDTMVENLRTLKAIPDGYMDMVFGINAVEYNRFLTPNPYDSLARVLRPGGRLALLVHHQEAVNVQMARWALKEGKACSREGRENAEEILKIAYHHQLEVVKDLEEHGFQRVRVRAFQSGISALTGEPTDQGWFVTALRG